MASVDEYPMLTKNVPEIPVFPELIGQVLSILPFATLVGGSILIAAAII
jgi:hypothetical protein